MRPSKLFALLISLNFLITPMPLLACAIARPTTADGKVSNPFNVNVEQAIIIWDEKTKTEHFIRSAEFSGEGKDLGFLVPTPSVPELSETSNEFSFLRDFTKAERIEKRVFAGFDFTPLSSSFLGGETATTSAPMTAAKSAVRVLDKKTVGGYDAVVLEADSAAALGVWLKKHNYASTPELTDWLANYIKAHWKITAFKVANNEGERSALLSAVRMSFKTDKPFYPYREPKTETPAEKKSRVLWVWFVGAQRMNATIGESGNWPAVMDWSNSITTEQRQQIASNYKLPVEQIPDRLTEFIDTSSPRPATDELYFLPAADQSIVKPPPIVDEDSWQFPLPLDLIAVVFLLAPTIYFWRKRARRRLAQ